MKKEVKIIGISFFIMIIISIAWFTIKYLPLEEEQKESKMEPVNINQYRNQYSNTKIEELPEQYTQEQAILDECFVIGKENKLYNKEKLDEFFLHTYYDSKNRKDASLRIVEITEKNNPIITEVIYKLEEDTYSITIDKTRDKTKKKEERKITKKENLSGQNYTSMISEEKDKFNIYVCLYKGNREEYEDFLLGSYSQKAVVIPVYPYFYGIVEEVYEQAIILNTIKGSEMQETKVSSAHLGNKDIKVGDCIKITHTGMIQETYPVVVNPVKVKKIEDFDLTFIPDLEHPQKKIKILANEESAQYDYDIYTYGGEAKICVNNKVQTLRDALIANDITMDKIIKKVSKQREDWKVFGVTLMDGGTTLTNYPNYRIIHYNKMYSSQTKENRDFYIGNIGMNIEVNEQKEDK